MGRGSYTASDWSKLKTSKKLDTSTSASQIFLSDKMNPKMDPKFIGTREARDSDDHPNSTPIIIGVDVTGSMGYLSTQIIKESLNELMQQLYSKSFVKDPQMMFAAIGDASYDTAPLQVTQFESDIRIAEQLLQLWIEDRGGDSPEDYQLLWYFADKHTDIDCFNKRGEKGFCFTIGDASIHDDLSAADINRVFGDKSYDISSRALAQNASRKYELFHIMIDHPTGNFADIIPGRVICISKSDINYLPEIIISAMQLTKGYSTDEVLKQWGELARQVVKNALANIVIKRENKISF